jgi:LuxR family transcriptional regulator, quorum-sensing system regulator BjaR1
MLKFMAHSNPNGEPPSLGQPDSEKQRQLLSPREAEVLGWAARGKSASDIATILRITKRTVDAHAHAAAQKLGAVNRTNAVAIAVRDQLIHL